MKIIQPNHLFNKCKNAGVVGYVEAFLPVQSDSQASEWCSYFENDVLETLCWKDIEKLCLDMFEYQITNEWIVMFRKMLMIEQFKNPEVYAMKLYAPFFMYHTIDVKYDQIKDNLTEHIINFRRNVITDECYLDINDKDKY